MFSVMGTPEGAERRSPGEKLSRSCDTEEEARQLVREFWEAMPHGQQFTDSSRDIDWSEELTMGDRTKVIKCRVGKDRGKWLAIFSGNHQSLTPDAENWLRQRGLVE